MLSETFSVIFHHRIFIKMYFFQVLKEIQSKREIEMVQRIMAQVKAECEATGGDSQRRGYTKHF